MTERLFPSEDLKDVQIGSHTYQVAKIGIFMYAFEERELVDQLIKNVNLFAWAPYDIPGIGTKVVSHYLVIHPSSKPMAQRKRKVDEEKKAVID